MSHTTPRYENWLLILGDTAPITVETLANYIKPLLMARWTPTRKLTDIVTTDTPGVGRAATMLAGSVGAHLHYVPLLGSMVPRRGCRAATIWPFQTIHTVVLCLVEDLRRAYVDNFLKHLTFTTNHPDEEDYDEDDEPTGAYDHRTKRQIYVVYFSNIDNPAMQQDYNHYIVQGSKPRIPNCWIGYQSDQALRGHVIPTGPYRTPRRNDRTPTTTQ